MIRWFLVRIPLAPLFLSLTVDEVYSGLFITATHPLILRALYIDGDAYQCVCVFFAYYILFIDNGQIIGFFIKFTRIAVAGVEFWNIG